VEGKGNGERVKNGQIFTSTASFRIRSSSATGPPVLNRAALLVRRWIRVCWTRTNWRWEGCVSFLFFFVFSFSSIPSFNSLDFSS
jgi:hypothetical protein